MRAKIWSKSHAPQMESLGIPRTRRRRRGIIEPILKASASEAVKGGLAEKKDEPRRGGTGIYRSDATKKSATLCLTRLF
jgi:hypothetical protein